MRLRVLFPLLYTVLLAVVTVFLIEEHGGWKGDARQRTQEDHLDVVSGPEDVGLVLLNRWVLVSKEPYFVRAFMWANVAGFEGARVIVDGARRALHGHEFARSYPYGISYLTYPLLLGALLSFLQWYGIGVLVDWLRAKRTRGRLGRAEHKLRRLSSPSVPVVPEDD